MDQERPRAAGISRGRPERYGQSERRNTPFERYSQIERRNSPLERYGQMERRNSPLERYGQIQSRNSPLERYGLEEPRWNAPVLSRATTTSYDVSTQDIRGISRPISKDSRAFGTLRRKPSETEGQRESSGSGRRKRKRSRGDPRPSEGEIKAAATSDDDEALAARLVASSLLPAPSAVFTGALQAIIHQARLTTASGPPFDLLTPPPTPLSSLPPPIITTSSHTSHTTAAPLTSSSQLPLPDAASLDSFPRLSLDTSHADPFTQGLSLGSSSYLKRLPGGLPVQSSSHTDLFSRNLPVQSSGHGDLFTRDIPVQFSSHVDPFTRNPPALSSHTDPFSRKLSWQSSSVTDAFTRNLSGRCSGLADLFTRNIPVQSPRQMDSLTRNLPVISPSRKNLFARNLHVESTHSDLFPGNIQSLSQTALPSEPLPTRSSSYVQTSGYSHQVSSALAGSIPPIRVTPSTCTDPARTCFSPEDELRKLQAAGPRLPSTYECKECGRTFSLPQSLGGHMSRHRREERLKLMHKKKVEADTREIAESLCDLQTAAPENSGSAQSGADAPGMEEKQSAVMTEKPVAFPWKGDQQQQQQQQQPLDQKVSQHRLTMLPDRVLVPPVSPLVDPPPQQHERERCFEPALVLLPPASPPSDYVTRQHKPANEDDPDPVSHQQHMENVPSGILPPSGVARRWPQTVQLQSDNHSTTHTTPTGSRVLEFDLNFAPSDKEP